MTWLTAIRIAVLASFAVGAPGHAQVTDVQALASADVPTLIETVKSNADIHGDIVLGMAARDRLAEWGRNDSAAVVPQILAAMRALDAPNQDARQKRIALIGVLQDMGAAAEQAVPLLTELANGPGSVGEWVKFQAGAALAAIGTPDAEAARQSAARAVADDWVADADDAEIRKAVAEQAYLIRKEIRSRQPADPVIEASVQALAAVGGRAESATLTLLRASNDPRLGRALRGQIVALLNDLGVANPDRAATALAAESEADPVAAVIRDTRSEHDLVRSLAMMELGDYGPSDQVIDALVDALRDGRSAGDAALQLGEFGSAAKRAVPDLVRYVDDESAGPNAIQAIAKIGEPTEPAMAALKRLVAADGGRYRANAASALGELGVAGAVPELAAALTDARKYTRILSANALGKIGPEAAAAVPDLAALLLDRDADVRRSATEALGRIGPSAEPAVALIGAQLDDPDNRLKQSAEWALERIGGARAEAILAADAERYLAADRAEYRRIRRAGDLPAIGRFLSPLPPRRRLFLAEDISADAEPEVAFYGALIFVEAGEAEAAVPALTHIVANSDRGTEMLMQLAGAAAHGGESEGLSQLFAATAAKLAEDFEAYTPEQQARIRAAMKALGRPIE